MTTLHVLCYSMHSAEKDFDTVELHFKNYINHHHNFIFIAINIIITIVIMLVIIFIMITIIP